MEYKKTINNFYAINQIYGKQFYEICCFLRQLNYNIPKLRVNDISYILENTNQNSSFSVACMALDYILKI